MFGLQQVLEIISMDYSDRVKRFFANEVRQWFGLRVRVRVVGMGYQPEGPHSASKGGEKGGLPFSLPPRRSSCVHLNHT